MARNYDDFFASLYETMASIPGAAQFIQEDSAVWDEKLCENENADIIDVEFEDITDLTDEQRPSLPLLPVTIKKHEP